MPTINEKLRDVFENTGERIWIYTDGSAATHTFRTGAYAAVILPGAGKPFQFVTGCCSSAKTGRMEISAVLNALYHVREFILGGSCMNHPVQIITDSEYVVLGATEPRSRRANLDLWASFSELSRGLDISINHMPRNTEPPQCFADALCHQLRTRLEGFLGTLSETQEFKDMNLGRNTRIRKPQTTPTETPTSHEQPEPANQ